MAATMNTMRPCPASPCDCTDAGLATLPPHDGTGSDRFDNPNECVGDLLQVEADHAHQCQQQTEETQPR